MAKTPKQITAFFGTDEAQVKEKALKLSRELTPPGNEEFGLELVNGNAETSDHASSIVHDTIAAIQTLPFFGGDKTVWLQGANFLADNVTGRAAATVAAVERLAEVIDAGLPPGVNLIISGLGVDKRRAFYKKLSKIGEITIFDLPDPSKPGWEQEVMNLAQRRAKEIGFDFDGNALEHFVMLTGENTRQLDSELEKLFMFIHPEKSATVEDVREIVSESRAGVIFEIGDAIAARNLPKAIELIDHQLRRGENAVGILLAAIVPRVRNLVQARELMETYGIKATNYKTYESNVNRLPKSATSHLPQKKAGGISAYPIFLASKACKNFTLDELIHGLEACLEANLRLVTTQMEAKTVLSQLVTKLLSRKPR